MRSQVDTDHTCRIGLTLLHFVAGAAALVLVLGHVFDITGVRTVLSHGATMVASTAIAFAVLTGVLAWSLESRVGADERSRLLVRTAALGVVAIGISNIAIMLAGRESGLNGVAFERTLLGSEGAMAPFTSVCFVLAGLSGLSLTFPGLAHRREVHALPTLGLVLSLIALDAYLLAPEALRTVVPLSQAAFHTSFLFVLLFLGIMLVAPHPGWVGQILGPRTGSREIRTVGLAVLVLPSGIAYLMIWLAELGTDWHFLLVVNAVLITAILGAMVLVSGMRQIEVQRRLAEGSTRLETALEDRNILLAEVYHRVKNSLQQVDALLWTEQMKFGDRPEVQASFEAMSGRIRAIAAVHQQLLQNETISKVELSSYLKDLVLKIASGAGLADRKVMVDVDLDFETVMATLSTATTLGLLLNEVLANSIKHAFDGESGRVSVRLGRAPDDRTTIQLVMADDGKGYDPATAREGIGMALVNAMVRQLQGKMTRLDGPGTRIEVRFPASVLEEHR